VITEIGAQVGDIGIACIPWKAIREFRGDGPAAIWPYVQSPAALHRTSVNQGPASPTLGEELRSLGIQPDLLWFAL